MSKGLLFAASGTGRLRTHLARNRECFLHPCGEFRGVERTCLPLLVHAIERSTMHEHRTGDKKRVGQGSDAIALVGLGLRFPGGVAGTGAFWDKLCGVGESFGRFPRGRFDIDAFLQPGTRAPGKVATDRGGFLEHVDRFDADAFGISPREARKIDPQHRILLEASWEALEDAGIVPSEIRGSRAGVFMGLWSSDYEFAMYLDPEELDLYTTTGGGRYAASGRISFALDLRGPSLTLDTACSSGLVALHLACRSLRTGESDLALAGAANLVLQPQVSIAYSRSGMLSPGARCRFGAADPDGYVRSEGVAVAALKRLDDALRDGDPIHSVVLGSAVNSDGAASGRLVAPSMVGQAAMLREAYRDAGVDPRDLAYVEAHGTGTRAGDDVELGALGEVLAIDRDAPLPVGSVKTRIGHTEAASGMAGVVKAALALERGSVPPGVVDATRNPDIPWDELGVSIHDAPVQLHGERPIIGVNSFGVTGTNAHIVLTKAPSTTYAEPPSKQSQPYRIVAVSGGSADSLSRAANALADRLESEGDADVSLDDLAWTTLRCREHLPHRAAIVAKSVDEVRQALRTVAPTAPDGPGDADGPRIAHGVGIAHGTASQPADLVFVFSPDGPKWVGPVGSGGTAFDGSIAEADSVFSGLLGERVAELLERPDSDHLPPEMVDPVRVVVQIALASQLESWGIRPSLAVGIGVGEISAAVFSGAWSIEDGMRVAVAYASGDSEALRNSLAAVRVAAPRIPLRTAGSARTDGSGSAPESGGLDVSDWVSRLKEPPRTRLAASVLVENGGPLVVDLGCTPKLVEALGELSGREAAPPIVIAAELQDTPLDLALLEMAARIHVDGGGVDWAEVGPNSGRTLRLPTREWDRESFWIDDWEDWGRGRAAGRDRSARPEGIEEFISHIVWEPVDVPVLQDGASTGTWLIVSPKVSNGDALDAESETDSTTHVAWVEALADTLRSAGADVRQLIIDGDNAASELNGIVEVAGIVVPIASASGGSWDPVAGALDAAKALGSSGLRPTRGTWWVTWRGQTPPGRSAVGVELGSAAAWGLVRTLWEEHPDLDSRLVDLDSNTGADLLAPVLVAGFDEPHLAFAGSRAYASRIATAPASASRVPLTWRPNASYLITGGTGGLGLAIAKEMVESGARRLILAARTPLPPRSQWGGLTPADGSYERVRGILDLEGRGASVYVMNVDLADREGLAQALEAYRAEAWPPIRGVVHCAGVLENRFIADLDRATLFRTLGGKACGASHLSDLLPDLEVMILVSSVLGSIPQPGQGAYAAANAALDALAVRRTASGAPTASLAWGVWKDSGMTKDAVVARWVEGMEAQGLESLDPAKAVATFRWAGKSPASSGSPAHLLLLRLDGDRLRARAGGRVEVAYYARLGGTDAESDDGDAAMEQMRALTGDARASAIRDGVRTMAAAVLARDAADISVDRPLGNQGLDSLMAMELRNRLERDFGLRLPASVFWNHPTIQALSEHIAFLMGARDDGGSTVSLSDEHAGDGRAESLSGVLGDLDDRSDEDLLRELRGEKT